jgi:hypothetical protein
MASSYEGQYLGPEAGVAQYEAYGITPSPSREPAHHQHDQSGRCELEQPMVEKPGGDGAGPLYRDAAFALLFGAQLLGVLVLAVAQVRHVAAELPTAGFVSARTLRICVGACAMSFAFSACWLAVLRQHARTLIWLSAGCTAGLYALTSIWLLVGGNPASVALGLMLLGAALAHLAFVVTVRERVAFSATLLSTVATLLHAHPALILLAAGAALVMAGWLAVWSVAMSYTLQARALALASPTAEPTYGAQGGVVFALLLSFYWTAHVVKNVVHVTVAGTVGSWYFLAPTQLEAEPTRRALKRALTTSLGSICLGALLVSAIRVLRLGASAASRRTAAGPLRACLLCALGLLDVLVRFFNQYAFTHIALYGKPFTAASRDTWALLSRCGIDVLAQKELTGSVLLAGSVAGGLFNVLVFGAAARSSAGAADTRGWLPVTWLVFLIGAGVQLLVSAVVESAICALYVCYAEDPNALASVNPQLYAAFVHANPTVPLPRAPAVGARGER